MWPEGAIDIAGRRIGAGCPLFTIAEIGLNHGGSVDRALALVDAAADAGASAIKLQTVVARDLVSSDCPPPAHVSVESLEAFFAAFELDDAAHARVAARARARGLAALATPLSLDAVTRLDRLGFDAYKIASGDLTWHALIAACAATGRPLILSTGLSSLDEVAAAVSVARSAGARTLALLHCVSAYPVPAGSENLLAMVTLGRRFHVPVGLSDHAADAFAVPMVVTLGGSIYERHIVLEGDDTAVDREVSSGPQAFAGVVRDAARARAALGHGRKECLPAESPNRLPSRRALCAARDLAAGHVITAADLVALRPASGLAPAELERVVGLSLLGAIPRGRPIVDADLVHVHRREHVS